MGTLAGQCDVSKQRMAHLAKRSSLALRLFLAVFLFGRFAGAQSTVGTILGTVSDPSGAVIAGVNVTVTNTATGISRAIATDEAGSYKVLRLLPGLYTITAEMAGFKKATVTGIVLQVNQEARYDIHLEVGEVTQEISVSAEGVVQVQTEDSTLGQVVDQQKIVELPLNGRNFMQLVAIGAGAIPIQPGTRGGEIIGETKRDGASYSVSGLRETMNSYLVDGVEARSEMYQMVAMQTSLDAIQEFKIQRNAFSAEFGGAANVVNVAIKSGTNNYHGTAFEFLRNDALDAAQYQDPVVNGRKENPPFRMNQFGGSFGGPIFKNRSFFFGSYEGLRRYRFAQFPAAAFPTRFRSGDFSTLKDASGNPIPIFDPLTYDPATGKRQQFPGNIIPTNRLDRLALDLLEFAPPPQNEFAPLGQINTVVARNRTRQDDQINVRIDHKISDRTTIFGRYSQYKSPIVDPLGYAPASTFSYFMKTKNLAVGITHTASPRTINEFRFGYNKDHSNQVPDWDGGNVTQELGIKNLNPIEAQWGIPGFSGVTFTGAGPNGWEIVSNGTVFQYTDVLTLIRGAHTVKLGGEIRDMRPWAMAEDTDRRGTFNFTGEFTAQLQSGAVAPGTGSDMADFVLGISKQASGSTGSTYTEFVWTNYHGFVQDDWKINPNLTLNLGLRYEYNMQGNPRDGKLEAFCSTCLLNGIAGDLALTDRPNASGKQLRKQVVDPDFNNFGPRVGFAWTPFAGKDTVLRGGFGMFYVPTKGDEMNFRQHHPDKTQLIQPLNENPNPAFFMARDAFPAPIPGFNKNPFTIDPSDRWPYVMQWNLNGQRKLAKDWLLEVGYVGTRGVKLSKRWNFNQARLDTDPLRPTPISSRVPFPNFVSLWNSVKDGTSSYHGLQVRLERTFSGGFYILSTYSYSRCTDLGTTQSDSQNVYDRKADWGLCNFHVANRFNASYGWKLPFGQNLSGFAGKVAKGWQVNSIVQLQDGVPFTPSVPGDPARVGTYYTPRFNRVCDGNLPDSQQTVDRFFDTSCFVLPQSGTFGNSARNVIFGPGLKSVDFSIFKTTNITETVSVQFRTEIFNAFNHSNYNEPRRNGPLIGRILTENDAREFQFGLKIIF